MANVLFTQIEPQESEDEEMTILEFAKTYGLDVRKVTQAIDNLKEIQTILSRSDEEKPREAEKEDERC